MTAELPRGVRLLARLIPSGEREAIVGDLLEEAACRDLRGARQAAWLAGECGAIAAIDNGKAWGGARRPKREDAEKAATANCEKRPGAKGKCKVKTAQCNK